MISEKERLLIKKAKEGDEGSFETLILSCKGKAYNIALRYVKNENDAMDILQESFIKEHGAYILDCLEKIPIEHKKILILRDIKGFAYEDISEILDCSIGTVKSRISRARNNLKEVYLKNNIKE